MAGVDTTESSLIKAARVGNLKEMYRLIEGGARVNAVNENDQTALMIVAKNWRYFIPEIAIALIKGGADVNMKDKDGKTALMHAIAQKSEDIALDIIKHSKDLKLNAVDNEGQTALMKAAINKYDGMKTIADALIKRGADVNIQDIEGKTALMYAVAQRDEDTAPLAIIEDSDDLDLNAVDNRSQTALIKAVRSGRTTIVDALIKRGADVNIQDIEGKTALMHAIAQGDEDTAFVIIEHIITYGKTISVDALIKRGADVNIKDKEGKTALMHAIAQKNEDIALAIIKHSKDLDSNAVDNEGQTALMYAIDYENENTALAIIENCKDLDIDTVDNQGQTALMKAAFSRGMTTFALALIKRGADVNVKDNKGKTALMYAIAYPNENTALAIIENSKDLNLDTVDNQGQTALMKAVFTEMKTIADALITRGADVNVKDKEGQTALMYSIAYANENIAFAIMENSKDLGINTVDNQDQTALMKAVFRGMTTIADALITRGADVNIKYNKGKTALMYAITYANENTALAIIENSKDLDINTVDNQGQTALMKAAIKGMTTITDALIKRGADVNMKDKEGKTALMYAIAYKSDSIAAALISETSNDFSVNRVDNQGKTVLMKAIIDGMTRFAIALIKRGAYVNVKDKEGETTLMHAIAQRDEDTAFVILEHNKDLDLNAVDNQGKTALMTAITDGMTRFAIALIKRGADVNVKDKKGKTTLMHAIAQRAEDTALAIIEHSKDLDLNAVDNQGQTELMKAAIKGMTRIAIALIIRGVHVNFKDKEGETALMHAIAQRDEDTAFVIIEHSKDLDLNTVDNQGQTAWMKATLHRKTIVSQALIKRGVHVNIKNKEGKTALLHAIAERDEDTALAIIEQSKDLDLNAVDNQGQTALMKAALNRKTKVADALIKRSADVNMEDKEGKTALMYAIGYKSDSIAAALISETSNDFSVNSVDNQGKTALMKAITDGMTKFAIALIKRGADVNMKDKEGKTALMYAISYANEITALAIMEKSKDLNLDTVGYQGQTALMKAIIKGMTTIAKALITRGADVNMKDKEGKTALMYAIGYKRDSVAAALISETSNDFSVNSVNNQGQTVLVKAITDGMTRFAIALIKRGVYVNVKDKEGKTALVHAIAQRDEDTAFAIIEHSKDLAMNAVDNQGKTALMTAITDGMTRFAIALIKRGAYVNVKDKEGKTALVHAIAQRDEDTAFAIIKHSKDLAMNAVDNQGQTALKKAIIVGMRKFAIAFVKRGADVNFKDKEGETALMHAIAKREEVLALAIIEHSKDLDLNAVNNQGQTALMKAISIVWMTTFAIALIKRGAYVNLKDKEGKTALMHAIAQRDEDTALAIIEHSKDLDLNAVDNQGQTALMKAAIHRKTGVLEALIQRKASVDAKNNLGRTALFYALVESYSAARYLLENGANLHLIDNYNVSVLSYLIHHCIYNGGAIGNLMEEKLALLKDNGVKKETIVNGLINAVFCKLPLLMSPVNTISKTSITKLLTYASYLCKLSKKRFRFKKDNKCRLLQDLVVSIDRDEYSMSSVFDLSIELDKLLELGADPNSCDEQGSTIAHHITLLGVYDNTVEAKNVIDVLLSLEKKRLQINKKNCKKEIPLFFMLTKAVNHDEGRLNKEVILDLCIFFLERDSAILKETSQTGDSVFHLLIKLSSVGDINEESLERCIMEILRLFSQQQRELSRIVNSTNDEMNTPLHVWAAGSQQKSRAGKRNNQPWHASDILNWQGPSKKILDQLLRCGAVHHARNLKAETPLHMCRTWTAVKLLFKAGAKTNDVDALGRSPLLSAANNLLFLEKSGCFYPDVSPDEAPTFWQTVLDMRFDLWTCDENGDSIISILIKENSFELADGWIEIACDNSQSLSDKTLVDVLNAICKDESTQTTWKSILVDKLLKQLKSTRRSLDLSLALRSCCMNIRDPFATLKRAETTEFDSVHYEIVKQLLRYGASGESCLDVAENCPPLKTLLSTPVSMEERPLVIPWTSCSQKHKNQLAEVARQLNCNTEGSYWYHETEIGHGAFGQVFVGIHEKDRMEVAVKRVRHTQQDLKKGIREIRTLASLSECEHIVRYLTFFQTSDYSFIIMELMEGNLIEYFASAFYDRRETKELCRDVALGLKYLHDEDVIHRDLKPNNILYNYPKLCLKIADFGLSRRIDVNASFTVMATGVGTRGWISPEVMKSTTHEHSTSSDVFSCGLVFHYILSKGHRHPFSPADCTAKSELEIIPNTEINILNNNMEGWDSGLDPEASHVIKEMLNCTNEKERPTASILLHHTMFWSKKKKLDFLTAVGNQEEFECSRAKRPAPSLRSDVEKDLENEFATIVKFGKWDDPRYTQTSVIFIEMQKPIMKHDKKGKPYNVPARKYDIGSTAELVRFIRNAIAHVASQPPALKTQILDAVFLEEFPNLVIEVFKAVTAHGWDVSREEIKHVLAND